jgi:hypothetical protein
MSSLSPADRRFREEPTYWFVVLETARRRGDFERALQAQDELRRLGICVSYRRPPSGKGEGPQHAA